MQSTEKKTEAHVPTQNASSYLRQLCRHWSHRFPVEFDEHHGRIELQGTICMLKATSTELYVQLEIDDGADPDRMESVVAEHLQRFGFRETLVFDWKRSWQA